MIVKMILADTRIGDEVILRAEADTDAFGNSGKGCGKRGPNGAVENPDRAQALPPQQRHQRDQVDAAAEFLTGMLEIDGGRNARFRRKQFLGGARGRRKECHAGPR